MNYRFLFLLVAFSLSAHAQTWSKFLDPSRAIDWSSAGFTIPNYTTNCSTQPTLTANSSSAASSNSKAIQNALSSCDATHNLVNIPAGTYYVAGITMPPHGNQVLRGVSPASTKLISTGQASCGGISAGLCMISANWLYSGSSPVLPSGGTNQCIWSAGYTQGTTKITLSNCGSAPPKNHTILLDQANDSSDTGGVYICDEKTPASCNYDGTGSAVGRQLDGMPHTQIQVTYVTEVSSLGGGSYSVTISPGVYFTNIRSSQNPGAWWSDMTQNNGVENLTIDGTSDNTATLTMFDCYHCWAKNVAFLNGARGSIILYQSGFDVIRDSYFYQAQGHAQISYNIDAELSSGYLIENNIMQQVTTPVTINNGTGGVIAYNFGVNDIAFSNYTWPAFVSHNAGNEFNLWEGNVFAGFEADDAWGSPAQQTYFRNLLSGWQNGRTQGSTPVIHRSYVRAFNIIGNVMGQPGYHTQYQTYATSKVAGIGSASENKSIYSLGWGVTGGCGNGTVQSSPYCDPLAVSSLMRWGNYDTVTANAKWDSTEASPGSIAYVNANFTSSYFTSLSHQLPASLYYSSQPSWWPSSKIWPAIGPDVTSGNLGICSGTYSGSQATSSSQCIDGNLNSAWASHANSIPAQDCYLSVMNGPPDGTGNALSFDASKCYTSSGTTKGAGPDKPTGLTGKVVQN